MLPTRHRQVGFGSHGILLMPVAAIAVHQLRYWLAYGRHANAELVAQGHSYLHSLVPWVIFALAAGGGLYLRRVAAALRTGRAAGAAPGSAVGLWLASFAGLLIVYGVQETLEGFLATGHPAGMAGVFGHGGFWAVPAAAVVAAAVTAVLLLGRALVRYAATVARTWTRMFESVMVPAGLARAVVRPLARSAAGRAPPPPFRAG